MMTLVRMPVMMMMGVTTPEMRAAETSAECQSGVRCSWATSCWSARSPPSRQLPAAQCHTTQLGGAAAAARTQHSHSYTEENKEAWQWAVGGVLKDEDFSLQIIYVICQPDA